MGLPIATARNCRLAAYINAVLALAASATADDRRPNIVFILCDDLGSGDVSRLNPDRGTIRTLHIDRLAAEGMTFTDAHSGSALCTPTRYGLLTGRYAWRTRLQRGVLDGGNDTPLIAADRLTVAGLLGRHGYATGCIGKWHLGFQSDMPTAGRDPDPASGRSGLAVGARIIGGPTTRGFDLFFGCSNARTMASLIDGDRVVELIAPIDMLPRLEARAVDFIRSRAAAAQAGKPFFLYLPLTAPHTPIVPTPAWQGKSGLNAYADFVMQTDAVVGAVLAVLDAEGLAETTLVVFTADNGCSPQANVEELEALGHFPSAGFRGSKADIWEGGHRVPFIVRWPGRVTPGSTCRQTVCHGDFIATCAAILGTSLPDDAGEDSVSILPLLRGEDAPVHEAVVHHSGDGRFAIRQGRWKLALCAGSGGWSDSGEAAALRRGLPPVQLYDLEDDPAEVSNLAAEQPDVVARLTALLEKYVRDGRSTPGPAQRNDVAVAVRPMPPQPAPTGP